MPEQRFILYTRPDGGVSVCAPSLTALRYMTQGGGRWDPPEGKMWFRANNASHLIDVPYHLRGQRFIAPTWLLNAQIDAQAVDGVGECAARRFVHAMQFGGCTEAEAYEIMRDRFCAPHGSAFDLIDAPPLDRWFRDAWRRSHNGGPVWIAMPLARRIQARKIADFARERKLELRLQNWRARIRKAQTPQELKAIWPQIRQS
jgi:hypothetical protein